MLGEYRLSCLYSRTRSACRCMCARVCCIRIYTCACVRACKRACLRVCVRARLQSMFVRSNTSAVSFKRRVRALHVVERPCRSRTLRVAVLARSVYFSFASVFHLAHTGQWLETCMLMWSAIFRAAVQVGRRALGEEAAEDTTESCHPGWSERYG
jgi:hypothetical protein